MVLSHLTAHERGYLLANGRCDAVKVFGSAQVELSVGQRRRCTETRVKSVHGQYLHFGPIADYRRGPLSAGDVDAAGCADNRSVDPAESADFCRAVMLGACCSIKAPPLQIGFANRRSGSTYQNCVETETDLFRIDTETPGFYTLKGGRATVGVKSCPDIA